MGELNNTTKQQYSFFFFQKRKRKLQHSQYFKIKILFKKKKSKSIYGACDIV